MLKGILLIGFIIFSINVIGQSKTDTIHYENVVVTSKKPILLDLKLPDVLQIKNIQDNVNEHSLWEKMIPWIIALIIGIFSAIINFWISNRLRQSNERNLQKQIESNERNQQKQIESNERNIQKQIETSKESTLIGFKSTIASKNRQDWINELRQTLTEYLASTTLILPLPQNPTSQMIEDRQKLIKEISLSKAKIELLLNESKPEQKALLDKVEDMILFVADPPKQNYSEQCRVIRTNIIVNANVLFGIHWTKIKNLE